jgi:aspartokinase/homoserine dehydrogenase 1
MRVAKFGGTSLADAQRLHAVAQRVADREEPLAVVVSAMGSTTDQLFAALDAAQRGDRATVGRIVDGLTDLAASTAPCRAAAAEVRDALHALRDVLHGVSLLGEASPATSDLVVSHGERVAASLLASAIRRAGREAVAVDARDWLVTDTRFGDARVREPESRRRLQRLAPKWRGAVPVVTGFIGRSDDGRTTTLGRGGSDYTAALLAAQLGADALEIWTDVAGVYSADPRLVADAFPLQHMTYREALELATFGARVLHPRTLVPLMDAQIPMTVRSTLDPDGPATRIDARGSDDTTRATSVASLDDLAQIDVQFLRLHAAPGAGERIQRALDGLDAPVWLVTQSNHGQALSAVVPRRVAEAAREALYETLARELERGEVAPIRVHAPVALVTLVAEAMGQTPNVAGRLLGALGRVGVNVFGIGQSATQRSISVVVDEEALPTAVRTVHAAFHFGLERVSLLVLGRGTVGGALLRGLVRQAPVLRDAHDVELTVVGVATSERIAFAPQGLALDALDAGLADGQPWRGHEDAFLDALARLPTPILVDCTAADGMEALYLKAFRRGIHVVGANKKPLTAPLAAYDEARAAARSAHRAWRYETTVGAALPIVSTLHDLVRTGDQVRRVEGSFSGTLGFLCDRLGQGVRLSDAVREAMAKGYTEPRPQEDLAGTDAARKALILARELGLRLTLDDVAIEPLVDPELLAIDDVGAFLDALTHADASFEHRLMAVHAAGDRLRYLAVIDPDATPALRVGAVAVGPEHAAYGLRDSQGFVAFTTRRYADHPLVVQGAGAGGDVTASGVLADIIRIAEGLRG